MKKFTILLFSLAFFAYATPSKAQLDDGATAPDWTLTDINGKSWHLYDLLDSGRSVVVDFSTTWCTHCWDLRNTNILEDFYAKYGPSGNNTAMVFWCESDYKTNDDDLHGLSTGTGGTMGDWVTGTPYPIIDPFQPAVSWKNYDIISFPTVYYICPDKKVYDMYTNTNNLQVQSNLDNAMANHCSLTTSVANASKTNTFKAYRDQSNSLAIELMDWQSNEKLSIHLFNTMGQLVFTSEAQSANRRISIPLPTLESGLYFVNIQTGNGLCKTQKLGFN